MGIFELCHFKSALMIINNFNFMGLANIPFETIEAIMPF
jgi:hypothetical protein